MIGYRDKAGRIIFVDSGLRGDTFGTFWRNPKTGGKHRVSSPALPMRDNRTEAEVNLFKYGLRNKLERVEVDDRGQVIQEPPNPPAR